MNILSFDLETTGTNPAKDRIVQLSTILLGENLKKIESKKVTLNPTIPIPTEASNVHGITDEMVKGCYEFKNLASRFFVYFTEVILLGYNIKKFDIPLLSEEFARCGIIWPAVNQPIIDSMQIFHHFEKRDLAAAYKFYTNKVLEGAHDAENDNVATVEIFESQMFIHNLNIDQCKELCKMETLDFSGKFAMKDGHPIFNSGKHKGKNVLDHIDYCNWMLGPKADFTSNTLNVLRSILSQK